MFVYNSVFADKFQLFVDIIQLFVHIIQVLIHFYTLLGVGTPDNESWIEESEMAEMYSFWIQMAKKYCLQLSLLYPAVLCWAS